MKILKTILFCLFGLVLINGGLSKFFNYMPVPENLPEELIKDSMAMAEVSWLMPLVAAAELVGGLLILIPRTRPLGILIIFPVLVGGLLTHLTVAPQGLPMIIVLWLIALWMIADCWANFRGLFAHPVKLDTRG